MVLWRALGGWSGEPPKMFQIHRPINDTAQVIFVGGEMAQKWPINYAIQKCGLWLNVEFIYFSEGRFPVLMTTSFHTKWAFD